MAAMAAVPALPIDNQITFGGWPLKEYALPKIVVLGHDGKFLLAGVLPERQIGSAAHSELPRMRTAGKLGGQ